MKQNRIDEAEDAHTVEQPAPVPARADSSTSILSPPDAWNAVDQDSYDSFPASDPPGWIPQQLG